MLCVDLHCHSIASGHAANTIYELAQAASERGMEMIAITDHGPDMLGAPHMYYFDLSPRVPKKIREVTVLMGCEANIVNLEGEIDLPDPLLGMQDIVLAGLHRHTSYPATSSVEDNTKALIRAIERYRGQVHIIAHPYRDDFPIHIEPVVEAAVANGTLLEINVSLFRYRATEQLIRQSRLMVHLLCQAGDPLVIGSDAHVASELGDDESLRQFDLGLEHMEELNRSAHSVREWLGIERLGERQSV